MSNGTYLPLKSMQDQRTLEEREWKACNSKFSAAPDRALEATYVNYQPQTRRSYGLMEWPALLRKLHRLDPSYKL